MSSPFPSPVASSNDEDFFFPDNPGDYFEKESARLDFGLPVEEPQLRNITTLATGGTGEIFSARDDTLGRTVAVKALNRQFLYTPDQMERLVREAKTAAQLEHPNIVPIHTLGVSPTRGVYFTMKRLRGDSLRHIITQLYLRNPGYVREYSIASRLNIFLKICQGVSYAHNNGIIHRDLKPENVIVGNFGEVTIIDWGLVKKVHTAAVFQGKSQLRPGEGEHSKSVRETENVINLPNSNLTVTGEINGTPRFMSPEQTYGDNRDIDARSDIYALGIILYELLTFTNPFGHLQDEEEIMDAVSRGEFRKPRETKFGASISAELEAICLKAMSTARENRYQSVRELIRDVRAHLEDRAVSAYDAPLRAKVTKWIYRNPIKTAVLLSSVVAIVAYMLTMHIVTGFAAKETLLIAAKDCDLVLKKLAALEKNIVNSEEQDSGVASQLFEKQQTTIDEIDNLTVTITMLLGTIPQQQYDYQIMRLKEKLMSTRIRFTLAHGSYNDMKKVKGMMIAQFGYGSEGISKRLRQLENALDKVLMGMCTISIESSSQGATFTISPIIEDSQTGFRTPGEILSLPQNTLPVTPFQLPKGDYFIKFSFGNTPDITLGFSLNHAEFAKININFPTEYPAGTVFIPEQKTTLLRRVYGEHYREIVEQSPPGRPFFISAHEVTFGEYLEFWKQLESDELKDKFRSHIRLEENDQHTLLPWNDKGVLRTNTVDGKRMFLPDMPVVGISHAAAVAFCKWKGRQLNRICRLPTVTEWLRAATGDDARKFPWGNVFVNTAAFIGENRDAFKSYPLFAPVGTFKKDVSPYGLFDMAGNAREWTSTLFPDDKEYQVKGASASTTKRFLPLDQATSLSSFPSDIGFRYVLEYMDNIDVLPEEGMSEPW